ncbi:MAG: response regulator [Acidobacteriota bacterium]|nr:response regulator [Acidobacteriota bacterium]
MSERTLLYVEDEDAAVFLLETALKEAGIVLRLCRVSDGEQALSFLQKLGSYQNAPTPDLVLLDLNLPKINGLEVLAEVRANQTLNSIPVIVFTSSSLASDRRKSLALGAQEYITKPSSLDSFLEAVKNACSSLNDHV